MQSYGARTTEVFFRTFYEYRPEFSKALAPKLTGIEVCSVHALSTDYETHLFHPSRRERGDGFYWLDQVMRSAQLLGCKKYTFHGLVRTRPSRDDFDGLAEALKAASEFCMRYGVRLCLENVAWSLYHRPSVFRELKRRIPELYGVFDIKQARRSGYPYAMYIEEMAGSIAHVHLSDIDANGNICLPGRGIYDFTEILKRLKGTGFDGEVLVEVYPDNYGDELELKQSLEFLDETIDKLG